MKQNLKSKPQKSKKEDLVNIINKVIKNDANHEKISKFYNFSVAMHIYKELVNYVYNNVDKSLDYIKQQEQAWNEFKNIINNFHGLELNLESYEIKNLEMWFPHTLETKENILLSYVKKRINSIREEDKELNVVNNVLVIAKHKITKEVKQKIIPNIGSYQVEKQLEYLVKNQEFLPNFLGFDNVNFEDVEIMEAQNLIGLTKSKKIKNPEYLNNDLFDIKYFNNFVDQFDYLLMARVKKSKRELEKLVHWILGLKELSYDSIGVIEVVPEKHFIKEFYKSINVEGTDKYTVNFKYFPELENLLKNKKKSANQLQKEFNTIMGDLKLKSRKEAELVYSNLIKAKNYENTYKVEYPDYDKIISDEQRDLLLKELKIYRIFEGERLETLMFIPHYFKYYRGEIGHNTFYERWRSKKMENERIRANKDLFGKNLEQELRNLFFINNDESS